MAFYYHIYTNLPHDIAEARDERSYIDIARNLYHNGVYSFGEKDSNGILIPTSFRTPAHPFLYFVIYSIVGDKPVADEVARIVFLLMNVLSIYLIYRIGNMFNYYIGCVATFLMS